MKLSLGNHLIVRQNISQLGDLKVFRLYPGLPHLFSGSFFVFRPCDHLSELIHGTVTLRLSNPALLLHLLHELEDTLDFFKVLFGSSSRCQRLIRQQGSLQKLPDRALMVRTNSLLHFLIRRLLLLRSLVLRLIRLGLLL